MRTVMITGGRGQLATELARKRWPAGWRPVALGRDECDLSDPAAIATAVGSHDWVAVINAGAYTAVDRAEEDVAAAWSVNALAPAVLAEACRTKNIPIVQVSTDYVFDGARAGAWGPDDRPYPLGVYGASKLGGELAIATAGVRYAILRSSWVVSAHGGNFVTTMLRLAAERASVSVVDDQHGCPTSATDLADAAAAIAVRLVEDRDAPSGIWHFSNAGVTTWRGFAEAIMAASAARGGPSATVTPIATADYPTPARRPRNSVLSHEAIMRDFAVVPRPWREALDDILDALIGPKL